MRASKLAVCLVAFGVVACTFAAPSRAGAFTGRASSSSALEAFLSERESAAPWPLELHASWLRAHRPSDPPQLNKDRWNGSTDKKFKLLKDRVDLARYVKDQMSAGMSAIEGALDP